MLNRKKAFSLVEILFVVMLASVIAAMGMQVIRYVRENYRHIYYSAYSNLKKAVGVVLANDVSLTLEDDDPDEYGFDLCKRLSKVYGVIEDANLCTNVYNISPLSSLSTSNVNLDNPSFVLTNGQRFYIGNGFKPVGSLNYFDVPATMVVVDLNGEAGPNIFDTSGYTGNRTPDLVSFAILENGMVMPMSPMSNRKNYIRANVQLCTYASGCPSDIRDDLILSNVPLREALCVGNKFPADGGSGLGVQYNTDTSYAFKEAFNVNAACMQNDTTYCKVYIYNTLPRALSQFL